jgi:hypothetical protein
MAMASSSQTVVEITRPGTSSGTPFFTNTLHSGWFHSWQVHPSQGGALVPYWIIYIGICDILGTQLFYRYHVMKHSLDFAILYTTLCPIISDYIQLYPIIKHGYHFDPHCAVRKKWSMKGFFLYLWYWVYIYILH